jgi:hypothetical protein
LENVKVEGNNNNNEVYLTVIQCEGIDRAQVSHGVIQQGSSVARCDPKTDFHGHGDDSWGFYDEKFSG